MSLLQNSFLHFPGITARRELELWNRGIRDWEALARLEPHQLDLYNGKVRGLRAAITESQSALEEQDVAYFAARLPRPELYRLAATFPQRCLFLDIETTGLSRYYDDVTVIGWSVGSAYRALIGAEQIDALAEDMAAAPLIVTFNGSLFDLPFLRHSRGLDFGSVAHVDLRYLARRVDLKGGQKKIEEELGIARPRTLANVDGSVAVGLWFDYMEGDVAALRQLVRYNHADIEGMKQLFERVLQRLSGDFDFPPRLFPRSRVSFAKPDASRSNGSNSVTTVNISRYPGRVGPRRTYSDLVAAAPKLDSAVVVGIDLTGSENRASGWSAALGDKIETRLLSTDDAILEATLASEPTLVSIDSPLSLPRGRVTVSDDDPGRQQFGIVRDAERQLKQRGINVYPALLPSMQKLTERGIRLAGALRKKGVAVIESYPGAAQDILGIPRKRTSLSHLRRGLERFGYTGLSADATHDELDATTSALVGQFLLTGFFELLGSSDEDFLVVPTIERNREYSETTLVIGLSGPLAAGKTTAANLLVGMGLQSSRFSEILADELTRRGVATTRSSLQDLGADVKKQPSGQRWLQNTLADRVKGGKRIVLDGMRHPEDHAFLTERWGFSAHHVHIEASAEVRAQRYGSRENCSDMVFQMAERHEVEENVREMKHYADVVISNEGSFAELEDRLRLLIWESSVAN